VSASLGVGGRRRAWCARRPHDVVRAGAAALPGVPLHLWGVKLTAISARVGLPAAVTSVDSAAWSWVGDGTTAHRGRCVPDSDEWRTTVALPRALAKIEVGLARPKQLPLEWEVPW